MSTFGTKLKLITRTKLERNKMEAQAFPSLSFEVVQNEFCESA